MALWPRYLRIYCGEEPECHELELVEENVGKVTEFEYKTPVSVQVGVYNGDPTDREYVMAGYEIEDLKGNPIAGGWFEFLFGYEENPCIVYISRGATEWTVALDVTDALREHPEGISLYFHCLHYEGGTWHERGEAEVVLKIKKEIL